MRSDLECVARNRGGVAYLIAKWFRCVVLVFSPKAFGPENQKKIVRGAVVYKQATPLRGFRGRRCQSRAGYLGFTLSDSDVKEPEVFLHFTVLLYSICHSICKGKVLEQRKR